MSVDTGLRQVATALGNYIETLDTVIPEDNSGHSDLKPIATQYLAMVTMGSTATVGQYSELLNSAANALITRVQAWNGFSAAVDRLVDDLDQYTAVNARAGRMAGSSEDADTAVVLAVAQDGGTGSGLTAGAGLDILDANALGLASQRLEAMSASDQAKFQELLNQCGSEQEAAYPWKALSCGYPMSTLEAFDQAIAPFGRNPTLLARYLDVNLGAPESDVAPEYQSLAYDGHNPFDQGGVNDCVAASTVMAAVQNDPVLALFLTRGFPDPQFASLITARTTWTAGGHFSHRETTTFPFAAGDDSAAAVQTRAQALFEYEYNWGLANDGVDSVVDTEPIREVADQFSSGLGIGEWGQHNLANNLLGNMNGVGYTFAKMNDAADRANALQQIQTTVDSGVPVTFVVKGAGNTVQRHQMVISGSDAAKGMLEVYNPWGSTKWISSQDFIDGTLSSLTNGEDGGMSQPYNIEIPNPAAS